MDASQKLRELRANTQLVVDNSATQVGVVWFVLWLVLVCLALSLLNTTSLAGHLGLQKGWIDSSLGQLVIIAAVILSFIIPPVVAGALIESYFARHHRFVWRYLKHTELALYIVDDTLWEQIFQMMQRYPWLRLTGAARSGTLAGQLEFAAAYHRVLISIMRSQRAKVRPGVRMGKATYYAENALEMGCSEWGSSAMMLSGACVWLNALTPVWLPALFLFLQQKAALTAFCDYLLEERPDFYDELAPPSGLSTK